MSSTPVLHYFDLQSLGRGEVVRLFLLELGIKYENKLYSLEDWSSTNESSGLSLTGKLPKLEIDGYQLYQHIAILRYLCRRVGGYDGESNYERYLVDAVADIYNDWRAAWVSNLLAKTPDANYKAKVVPDYHRIFTDFYSRNSSGPYLLGDKVTYADFAVYQALDNDAVTGNAPDTLSEPLAQLRDAMSSRPNVKEYLSSR